MIVYTCDGSLRNAVCIFRFRALKCLSETTRTFNSISAISTFVVSLTTIITTQFLFDRFNFIFNLDFRFRWFALFEINSSFFNFSSNSFKFLHPYKNGFLNTEVLIPLITYWIRTELFHDWEIFIKWFVLFYFSLWDHFM